jgi:predicted GNAT family acetyltransferase
MPAATEADRERLVGWCAAFFAESGTGSPGEASPLIERLMHDGSAYVWEDGGDAVALVCHKPSGRRGGADRSGVHTPPERRGRGYASWLVAEVSDRLLVGVAERCMLFTTSPTRSPTGSTPPSGTSASVTGSAGALRADG